MGAEIEKKAEEGSRRKAWRWAVWIPGVLLVYVLSLGPFYLACKKLGRWGSDERRFFSTFYSPVFWAYNHTPLRKPLGMYFHVLWPEGFDKDGENRPPLNSP
jgi:hypothetical protein